MTSSPRGVDCTLLRDARGSRGTDDVCNVAQRLVRSRRRMFSTYESTQQSRARTYIRISLCWQPYLKRRLPIVRGWTARVSEMIVCSHHDCPPTQRSACGTRANRISVTDFFEPSRIGTAEDRNCNHTRGFLAADVRLAVPSLWFHVSREQTVVGRFFLRFRIPWREQSTIQSPIDTTGRDSPSGGSCRLIDGVPRARIGDCL